MPSIPSMRHRRPSRSQPDPASRDSSPGQLARQVTDLVRRLSGPRDSAEDKAAAAAVQTEQSDDPDAGWPPDPASRVKLIAALGSALVASARAAGVGAVVGGRWLTDLVEQTAPHVTIRDLATLERAYGVRGDALADAVVKSASHTTAGLGAAAGALAAVELAAPPALLATPVQLAAETLSVVAVELRMLGELHEVYGRPMTGSARDRASALLTTWVRRRALEAGGGTLLLGAAARRELRKRVMRRLGGSMTTLAPFLAGAVAGAEVNRRETRKLGEAVAKDLRTHAVSAFPAERVIEGRATSWTGR